MIVKRLNIAWISILLVVIIMAAGLFTFRHFIDSLVYSQHQVFITNAEASLTSINSRIQNLADQLDSYTELPSFGEIHYHQLTLNEAAVNQNKRALELYFFSLHRREPGYSAISFIDSKGREQIRISGQAISNTYRDFSANKVFQYFKENDHKQSLLYLNDSLPGQAPTISWWLPVLTSAKKKLGYLKFEITFELLKQVIEIQSRDKEIHVDLVDSDDRSLLTGKPVIKPKPEDLEWSLRQTLPLPGLGWEIHLGANQEILLDHIHTINDFALTWYFLCCWSCYWSWLCLLFVITRQKKIFITWHFMTC
ncbi:MAG: cache domain-containing protein [Gammaproteobacteria bacterium]|nr:cache domain-containing protein [Gammaproteobacteria bacterium]